MNNSSKIFVCLFVISLVVMSPYIIGNYIMVQDEVDEEEYISDLSSEESIYFEDETIEEDSNITNNEVSNEISNITSNIVSNEVKSNIISNQPSTVLSNKPSNKVSTSTKTSNKASSKPSNKTSVSNKQTTVKKSNTGRVNTVGKPPMTYTAFRKVGADYFNDALFIGDSRTEGLRLYGTLKNSTYFSTVGMSTFSVFKKSVSVKGVGNVTLTQLLQKKQFGKVYIMLGINEVGGNANSIASKYKELINLVRKYQLNAIIYIEGNLHVAKSRNDRDKSINNNRINTLNAKMASYANNTNIIYIDINYLFDDENGNLKSYMTSDATHVYGKYYKDWCNWLMEHAAS